MCGITGILDTSGSLIYDDILERMTDILHHRGPDNSRINILRRDGLAIGFGHRRLKIIDLSDAGRQPMTNEDQTIWLTFNGEIYNFQELRDELEDKGHVFSSRTDTEVIVHGYEEYGISIIEKLNGMFAFGLWDDRNRLLVLVRDRYGKKPLYYHLTDAGILFASEIKSLLCHREVPAQVDFKSLSRYLLFEYLPSPYCIIENVHKLPASHYLIWRPEQPIELSPYWQIRFQENQDTKKATQNELEEQLLSLFRKSVARRLVSDVPVGVFLSGGIDSSAIVAMMSEMVDAKSIKTFSIGFSEDSFDESRYAADVAAIFGVDHHEQIFTPEIMLDVLPALWSWLDEPFADASILPTYLLSRFTRQEVTVALGGDGGDELFAGYDPFIAHKAFKYYMKVPRFFVDSLIRPLSESVRASTDNMSLDFRVRQFLKGADYDTFVRNQVWLGAFSWEEQKTLLHPDIVRSLNGNDPYGEIRDTCRNGHFRDDIDALIFQYSRYYLENILTKIDRASMANSLEVRTPFLDVEFAEFVNDLPSHYKLRGFNRKYLLKTSLKEKLPKRIINRKKKGFGIPLSKWLKKELKQLLQDVFSESRLKKDGMFRVDAVHTLLNEHFSGRKDNRKQLWTLLMFEMWKENYHPIC
jgi:asparagine synthase (glutamine-hydrolysing)